MKPDFLPILTLGVLLAAVPLLAADDDTNSAPKLDAASFNIISQRNIFNPNRRGDRIRTPSNYTPAARVDSFTLVGTMSYEKGRFAFFDGTSSQYRKAYKLSDSIAGYKIDEITANSIKLSAASNQVINLAVGAQMRRRDGGPWSLTARAEPTPDDSMPAGASPDMAAKAASLNGAESDALKRLMLKRLKEQ